MIAERIAALREQRHLTQAELAKRLGVTRSSVNAWELGISVPSTQYLV
ncbi:MAG: helix-turn-helix transcriptional regulator [Candidatus Faecousia sp.]|nr:helix-turn-helix transcriptional regulator [Candidatus Faecousia sp.]